MKEKKTLKIEDPSISKVDTIIIIKKKINFFHEVLQKTILHVQKNKTNDILAVNEVDNCLEMIYQINARLKIIPDSITSNNIEFYINKLQEINNEISTILKSYGTSSLEDLLIICFGNNNVFFTKEREKQKFDLLLKYFHPISYKVVNVVETKDDYFIISDNNIEEKIYNMQCYDLINNYKQFYIKVYGIKIYLLNVGSNKCISVNGIVDNIDVDFINSKYIQLKNIEILDNLPDHSNYSSDNFKTYLSSLLLKDYLIYDFNGIYNKYSGYLSNIISFIQKQLVQIIKEFISSTSYFKRLILIQLLIIKNNNDSLYLCYLLYDLLSNDNNTKIDTNEQILLFDSFPWKMKQYFKMAMTKTIQYTTQLQNFDVNKIAIEQQICLMNTTDLIKEKAMVKLKEIKGKSEDSGSKARIYLDGLLKIPFGKHKREPILNIMGDIKSKFQFFVTKYKNEILLLLPTFVVKNNYTNIEIILYLNNILTELNINSSEINYLILDTSSKLELIDIIKEINKLITEKKMNINKINYSNKNISLLKENIYNFIDNYTQLFNISSNDFYLSIINNLTFSYKYTIPKIPIHDEIKNNVSNIKSKFNDITNYISDIKITLDKSVYGHDNAKKQIEIIIGQWINGEQDGYCFGFEGPPGVGKTSLAKRGLSNCLKDEFGNNRPFAMIQIGGDCNGSTLQGHNYTYIGSTWGNIVQILMDKKCMNPIIFIDEVDKISKTEHGKEIIGILTHLLDSTQNDCFQDKYFSGIDLDLSKALFILSYNDVDAIDKILLDRIHRVKFNNLTLEEKLIISNNHILPEIYKKMGLENIIDINEDVLKFIIEMYTSEAGVRKLKEILFQIIGEVNIELLKNGTNSLPIHITIDDIKYKFFKEKRETKFTKIYLDDQIGIINALWANNLGQGGTIPIQTSFVPSKSFLSLTLTGSQGEVMKESMNVALTEAWSLTLPMTQNKIIEKYNNSKLNNICGIHIHTPDCSTPKDGSSATAAITVAIYSLFNNIKIKKEFGITGELNFSGEITEIGGLEFKFLGGIKCGIKEFIFPYENKKDFDNFMSKYKDNQIINDIKFHSVKTIHEVLKLILVK
jgi:ATP-dependent Lon protease